MGVIEPYIGGNHVDDSTPEDHLEKLRSNRAIVVLPMNDGADDDPKLKQVQTIDEAFKEYKPSTELTVKEADGSEKNDKVKFGKVTDFSAESLVEASPALRAQKEQLAVLSDLRMQLKDNVTLRKAVDGEKQREQLVASLKEALKALQG